MQSWQRSLAECHCRLVYLEPLAMRASTTAIRMLRIAMTDRPWPARRAYRPTSGGRFSIGCVLAATARVEPQALISKAWDETPALPSFVLAPPLSAGAFCFLRGLFPCQHPEPPPDSMRLTSLAC